MASAKRTARRSRRTCQGKSQARPEACLLEGDCLEVLGSLEPESVDAIVTDPPYGIGLKHERWDSAAILEAVDVGGGKLSRNEAFEVWCRLWATECLRILKPGAFLLAFGSPRTYHRLSCGIEEAGFEIRDTLMWLYGTGISKSRRYSGGRSSTLKPAFEPVVLARRSCEGTTPETLDRHGTGALCAQVCQTNGRHPANVLPCHEPLCEEGHCEQGCAVAMVDASAARSRARSGPRTPPSRFLYCPKVSRAEREAGCEHLSGRHLDLLPDLPHGSRPCRPTGNLHPTVKPLDLMRWLVRLVCPPGGLVLDPFCGSGTTGAAAAIEGRGFLGVELEPTYIEIAAARIAHCSPGEGRAQVEGGPFGCSR